MHLSYGMEWAKQRHQENAKWNSPLGQFSGQVDSGSLTGIVTVYASGMGRFLLLPATAPGVELAKNMDVNGNGIVITTPALPVARQRQVSMYVLFHQRRTPGRREYRDFKEEAGLSGTIAAWFWLSMTAQRLEQSRKRRLL